jgi:hypothetical protein
MAQHSSFGAFAKEFRKRGIKLEEEQLRLLKETVIGVVTHVGRATPILTGQAQSNWLTFIGHAGSYYVANEAGNGGYQDSIDFARRALAGVKLDDTIHITNNVPYIVQLNRGTSKQAPALFVQTAVLVASYQIKAFKISWT